MRTVNNKVSSASLEVGKMYRLRPGCGSTLYYRSDAQKAKSPKHQEFPLGWIGNEERFRVLFSQPYSDYVEYRIHNLNTNEIGWCSLDKTMVIRHK